MNIFVVDKDPIAAARVLPDRHVTKMIVESAQMLSVVYSSHYWDCGDVARKDGTPFRTAKGAFKNHPCTQWAADNHYNCAWLIQHAMGLLEEYNNRYNKQHGLNKSLFNAKRLFHRTTGHSVTCHTMVDSFARAMPVQWKHDDTIDDVTAYRRYVNSKPWVYNNYLRLPDRRPDWITQPA